MQPSKNKKRKHDSISSSKPNSSNSPISSSNRDNKVISPPPSRSIKGLNNPNSPNNPSNKDSRSVGVLLIKKNKNISSSFCFIQRDNQKDLFVLTKDIKGDYKQGDHVLYTEVKCYNPNNPNKPKSQAIDVEVIDINSNINLVTARKPRGDSHRRNNPDKPKDNPKSKHSLGGLNKGRERERARERKKERGDIRVVRTRFGRVDRSKLGMYIYIYIYRPLITVITVITVILISMMI